MKARDLLKKLEKVDPDADVLLRIGYGGPTRYVDPTSVYYLTENTLTPIVLISEE